MLKVVDNIVIVAAVVIIVAIGAYFSKAVTDMESYYLANRSLPWSLVVGTLMASWYRRPAAPLSPHLHISPRWFHAQPLSLQKLGQGL